MMLPSNNSNLEPVDWGFYYEQESEQSPSFQPQAAAMEMQQYDKISRFPEEPPQDHSFIPQRLDIVCGRGKGSYDRPGNKRFREIAQQHAGEYLSAKTRVDKSAVLQKIVHVAQHQQLGHVLDNEGSISSTDIAARFVKQENGTWQQISNKLACQKAGHAVREAIAAMENFGKREEERLSFARKQESLLAQQKALFRTSLVASQAAAVANKAGGNDNGAQTIYASEDTTWSTKKHSDASDVIEKNE